MRLLNAKTKRLEEFFGKDIPPYAILSHTWGKDEVLFKDVTKGRYNKDSNKIEGCCREALGNGLDYVWIDTCCIDKRSSAELSEAINSMFDWYESSAACFAYLADIHDIMDLSVPESTLAFRESKWWTRGWTLQELLAPRLVMFYNASWTYLGEKLFLQVYEFLPNVLATVVNGLISEITGIEIKYLTGENKFCDASIAEKMSWAALRQTTREEDIAYSLLGIFNVNMPLLYDEKAKAFHRLQEAIISSSHDQSIFAWGFRQFRSVGNCELLASSPSDFVGFADVVPYIPNWAGISHYSKTNAGLQISMRLRKVPGSDNTFIGLLNCAKRNEKGSRNIAIALIPSPEHDGIDGRAAMVGQFIRCGTAPISISLSLFQEPDNDPAIPIYIRAGYMTAYESGLRLITSPGEKRTFVQAVEVYPPAWQFGADEGYFLDFNRILGSRDIRVEISGQQTIYLQYLTGTGEALVVRLKYGFRVVLGFRSRLRPSTLEFMIAPQKQGLSLAETIMMHKGQMDTALNWEQQLVTNDGVPTFRVDKGFSSDWSRPLWTLHMYWPIARRR
ncbi:heterokaryon incompatibility protein-domain-containing protein [Hyaloscypha finlandica]|nr:heterokaryon incompatibility protein-domain-containing protein [Hyaloscypha finlandica]